MEEMRYAIIRSNRKTMAITVDADGNVTVKAPQSFSDKVIHRFVTEKQAWILKQQNRVQNFYEPYDIIDLAEGSRIPYLGEKYVVIHKDVGRIRIDGPQMIVPYDCKTELFVRFMKKQIRPLLEERVDYFAKVMQVKYESIRISAAKGRWGSCSYHNSLNFTWRLMMCPLDVIDYIVVHELSHIIHKNHSKDFWNQVASVLPRYKEQELWLKKNRKLMDII